MFTGGTERGDGVEFTVAVVVRVFVEFKPSDATLDAGTTGGVDDPNLDGIEIDESEDVDDTGDGTAVTLVAAPLLDAGFVLDVGASKFDIVGECFLLFVGPVAWTTAGDETIDNLEFGDDTEVEVHVVGILLATVVAALADFPFGIVTAVLGC